MGILMLLWNVAVMRTRGTLLSVRRGSVCRQCHSGHLPGHGDSDRGADTLHHARLSPLAGPTGGCCVSLYSGERPLAHNQHHRCVRGRHEVERLATIAVF